MQILDALGEFVTTAVHGINVALRVFVLALSMTVLGDERLNTQVVGCFGQCRTLFVGDRQLFAGALEPTGYVRKAPLDE